MIAKHFFKLIIVFISIIALISCSKSDSTKAQKSLPTGTASLVGEIVSIEHEESTKIYKLKILDINQLGPGSPILVKGNLINVNFPQSIITKYKDEKNISQIGESIDIIIKTHEAVGKGKFWQILNFN